MNPIDYYSNLQSKMSHFLKQMVETESPSHNKEAVDRMGSIILEQLKKLKADIFIDKQDKTGDNILGQWNKDDNQMGILLLSHMDTVFPLGTLSNFPCREESGNLHGPGALDMKAGIEILLTCLESLQDLGKFPHKPINALFTSDEETGSHQSRPLIERLARKSDLVLCLEPAMPNGALKTWRKGVGNYKITAYGRAAHAGNDHINGRNAIEEIAHQILVIQQFTDYQKGTTVNVGVIHGGTVSNVVPENAYAYVDVRVMNEEETNRIAQQMMSLKPVLKETRLEIKGGLNRPPMPFDSLMATTFTKAQQIAMKIGIQLKAGGSGGGSDANFIAPIGIPVLDGLGALGRGMHSKDEYVILKSLPERAALLAAILTEWY